MTHVTAGRIWLQGYLQKIKDSLQGLDPERIKVIETVNTSTVLQSYVLESNDAIKDNAIHSCISQLCLMV